MNLLVRNMRTRNYKGNHMELFIIAFWLITLGAGVYGLVTICCAGFDFRKVKSGQIWRYTLNYNPFDSYSCRRVVLGVKKGYVRYETLGRGGITVIPIQSFRRNSKLEVDQ